MEFEDSLSNISLSIFDGKEEKQEEIKMLNLEINFIIEKIKKEFEEKFEKM